jgi:GNAT superfamily N-acetyltransferase
MIKLYKDINNEALQYFGVSTPSALIIKCNDVVVGMIDYEVYKDNVKIFYIRIEDDYRRQGIARRVIENIINENRGKYLYGDSLPGAIEFWRSLGAEFHEDIDEEYLTPFHIDC